jgi:hypothetical protein
MTLPAYFADVVEDMKRASASIRRDFATHRLTAGVNREGVLATFLREHLPAVFGVESGLLIAQDGQFSNQADLIIVDIDHNAPLYSASPERLWLIEAVYALIEVKTSLSPGEITDAIKKCRRFKRMKRGFLPVGNQRLEDSLFVLWGYEAPSTETLKENLEEAFKGVPMSERPDFVVVPGQSVARSGSYQELAVLGQANSRYRTELERVHGSGITKLLGNGFAIGEYGDNSLFAFFIWFDSWLRHAGSRQSDLLSYIPPNMIFGRDA